MLISALTFGQNVITNGSFETWNTATPPAPEGWLITLGTNGGSVTQETTLVQDGTSSVKLTAPNGTGNNRIGFTDIPVVAGTSYTIMYWYNDQTDAARFRHWGSWRSDSAALPSGQQSATFQPAEYLLNTTGWEQVTATAVAPVGATYLRLDFRSFQDVSGGGSVYVDNVVAGVTGTLSVAQNDIAGLKIYPNPVNNGNLFITTANNDTKAVQIFDVVGKMVVNTTVNSQAINVSALHSGVYVVKVTEAGKTATRKLVIK